MRSLARRILELNNEVADLDDLIEPLVTDLGARHCQLVEGSALLPRCLHVRC